MPGLDPEICLVYLDDIIVHSWDLGSYLERLERLFEQLSQAGLKQKVSKCRLLQREVAFLGHWVNGSGEGRGNARVADSDAGDCLREIRAFLALCSYYRKFVPKFAEIAAPLHALTRKNKRFQ